MIPSPPPGQEIISVPILQKSRDYIFASLAGLAIVACFIIIYLCWYQPVATVLLIRHAEKRDATTPDPPLMSPEGEDRARALAHVAGGAGLTAIYHTQFQRTRLTVEPLATSINRPLTQYAAADVEGLVNDILANHRGEVVLVAAHTDTVPQIITRFGGDPIPAIPESDFDNLFVITVFRFGRPKVVLLKYGRET